MLLKNNESEISAAEIHKKIQGSYDEHLVNCKNRSLSIMIAL